MLKKWSVPVMMGLVAVAIGFGQVGRVHAADSGVVLPDVTVTSPNDPTRPVPGGVRWFWPSHGRNLETTKNRKFDLCLLGDSITAMWPGDLFGKYFGKYNAVNFGIGGDRAENVLYRLQNGELRGTSPKVVMLLLGTNNSGMNTPGEIALGVAHVVKYLRDNLPETKVLLLAIFPSRNANNRAKIEKANTYLAKLDDGKMVRYLDINANFLDKEGKLRNDMFADDVHLTKLSYFMWGSTTGPLLAEMMGE